MQKIARTCESYSKYSEKTRHSLLKTGVICGIIDKEQAQHGQGWTRSVQKVITMERKISYTKLWKLLVDHKMSKCDLRKAINLAPNTMTKLRRDEEVAMSVLVRICEYFGCDIGDIVELV